MSHVPSLIHLKLQGQKAREPKPLARMIAQIRAASHASKERRLLFFQKSETHRLFTYHSCEILSLACKRFPSALACVAALAFSRAEKQHLQLYWRYFLRLPKSWPHLPSSISHLNPFSMWSLQTVVEEVVNFGIFRV